ncbi:agamous-like MADS-box protein AGL61 [Cinnamomum micranthum f. kanehirae]|uniref:Agamous-like MADS-box protein AGL61 n=1 Tax=Cinnamomum micranthum f. kanehirae TaxID=337451 RepID=A0A443PCG5_9MAGN|nr:agamous-like MADS-box protein AGL61 [Cinnamomum micranthum f. kanehirae]
MGKRKLEIESKKEEKKFDQLRFTRRCKGLFKKAQELNVLCGSDIAVIVISNGTGKATTFGSPDPNSVINRYRSHKTTNGQTKLQNSILARSDEQMIMNDGNHQEKMMMIEDLDLDLEPREDGSLPNLISSSSSYERGLDDNNDDYWLSLDVDRFLEEIEEEDVNEGSISERVLAGLMTEIPSSSSFSTIGCGAGQFAPSNGYGLGDTLSSNEFDPTFDVGQFLNEDGGGGPEQDEYGSVTNPISSSSSCECGFDDNDWLSIDVNKFFEDEEFVRMWVGAVSDQS